MKEDKINMIPMESGELQLRKAFEEVATKNLRTIQDYTTETRKMLRETEEHVKQLKNMIVAKDQELIQIKAQLATVLAKLYKSGS